ncbi:hypothetical protein JCM24511_07442 [Saitozyma sp. JCM 24511]|nr:hypothetical protein JCM24511_07442 [Saitozyma sp. JCM 24511]
MPRSTPSGPSGPSALAAAMLPLLALLPLLASLALANPAPRHPGEPADLLERGPYGATALGFEPIGDMGISAQMMFLSQSGKVYVLDKTENNPITISGKYGTHPAWAVEYDPDANSYRTMDVYSNTFCAGGAVLGNGTWVVFGGNQPVTTNGVATTSAGAYDDTDGGTAIRMLNPCSDKSCNWIQGTTSYSTTGDTGGWLQMTGRRWYPMVEVLEDGCMIVIGGDQNGGYVNTAAQDNPTYEYFPPKGDGQAINLQFLSDTLPVNLYALTWLMPSGLLFMQANKQTILLNHTDQTTTNLPTMPIATRVYPASAATAMLPLIPDNDYEVTLLFCGGSATTQWGNDGSPGYNVTAVPADNSCVRISPEASNPKYTTDDYMFEGRSMGQFVYLPDGTMWMGGGVGMGTAGYGNDKYSVGQSYGQAPVYMPAIYNFSAPAGSRWNRTGLSASANERMYHSTNVLLPDSSILISGSNPNADFTTAQWRSRTDIERWYPWYYNNPRPNLTNAPSNLTYGGSSFDLNLGSITDQGVVSTAKVVLIRGSFHTHVIGFGYRMIQLQSSYTIDMNTGNATLHVSQLPGNPGPTLFQPGPAMMFLVVEGVPSMGQWVMVGNGQLGTQTTQSNAALPSNQVKAIQNTTSPSGSSGASGSSASGSTTKSAAGLSVKVALPAAVLSLCTILVGLASAVLVL